VTDGVDYWSGSLVSGVAVIPLSIVVLSFFLCFPVVFCPSGTCVYKGLTLALRRRPSINFSSLHRTSLSLSTGYEPSLALLLSVSFAITIFFEP
jgi:hypothetical protein